MACPAGSCVIDETPAAAGVFVWRERPQPALATRVIGRGSPRMVMIDHDHRQCRPARVPATSAKAVAAVVGAVRTAAAEPVQFTNNACALPGRRTVAGRQEHRHDSPPHLRIPFFTSAWPVTGRRVPTPTRRASPDDIGLRGALTGPHRSSRTAAVGMFPERFSARVCGQRLLQRPGSGASLRHSPCVLDRTSTP